MNSYASPETNPCIWLEIIYEWSKNALQIQLSKKWADAWTSKNKNKNKLTKKKTENNKNNNESIANCQMLINVIFIDSSCLNI